MPTKNRTAPRDKQAKAQALANRLIRVCGSSGADSFEIISALSVVLGTLVGGLAASNPHVVDLTHETINRAVAYGAENDPPAVLQ